jgi:hypothetical protein
MDGWNGRYLAQCQFCFQRLILGKKGRKVPDGVLGGYCHSTMEIRSTCRVLRMKEDGHV